MSVSVCLCVSVCARVRARARVKKTMTSLLGCFSDANILIKLCDNYESSVSLKDPKTNKVDWDVTTISTGSEYNMKSIIRQSIVVI